MTSVCVRVAAKRQEAKAQFRGNTSLSSPACYLEEKTEGGFRENGLGPSMTCPLGYLTPTNTVALATWQERHPREGR